MIWMMTQDIWFGDKPSIAEGRERVRAVVNVAHSIRKPYWEDVSKLSWSVWYFKMASPDREPLSRAYLDSFSGMLEAICSAKMFPLLCHCRAGGHRGPTAAVFAHWVKEGRRRKAFDEACEMVESLKPGYLRESDKRVYRNAVFRYCLENSI